MRKLLNTLFVMNEKAYLSLEGETVFVEIESEKAGQFPLHTLESIICFSYCGATPALMGECAKRGINLAFYSPFGKFLCRVTGESRGNVLLRKQQYRISDNESASCVIARNFILGKVFNCRWSVDRTLRDHEMRIDSEQCRKAIYVLSGALEKIKIEDNLDTLRGLEGESATIYFSVFDEMILNQKEDFYFHGRNKRPPLDNVNAMLSFGYSLLANDCANALEGVGIDSFVGFMHRDRPGRKSLALDLMEELRPVLVDRFVLTLINNKQIKAEHFKMSNSGAVEFTDDGKKKFLSAWQNHKKEEIVHPYLKEKISWGLVPHVQALLLARHLRGDIDGYPPFLW
ncbi:MAG: type I-C CRISPR-associated endonuclease Cas1c, partial [Thermoflexaceae bacterium]|nr:type I-C CRISPR-associated endonuclease Cas1c [Thermoflexaceae bacterium]